MKILVINPGSTSTKVSLFEDEKELFEARAFHDAPELLKYPKVNQQMGMRKGMILDLLKERGVDPTTIDVFVGRSGSAHPQEGGVIAIDRRFYEDTLDAVGGGEHPAKLGVMLAYELGTEFGGKMFTVDPTNVDELHDCARITGLDGVYRQGRFHVLNQRATARVHAAAMGKAYEDCNFIVCHIDGGITISAHDHGRMVDGNAGDMGEGPFTPTRLGSMPVMMVLDYVDQHSTDEMRLLCSRAGGFVSCFGTSDSDKIHAMVESGNPKATLMWKALIYQIGKQIGAMGAVLKGKVDGILLTGGLMRFQDIIDGIREMCGFIAPITVYPGELEQEAMAMGALQAMRGERETKQYTGEPVWKGFSFDQ